MSCYNDYPSCMKAEAEGVFCKGPCEAKINKLKSVAQEVTSFIAKNSRLDQYGDVFVVELTDKLDKLLDDLDDLSK